MLGVQLVELAFVGKSCICFGSMLNCAVGSALPNPNGKPKWPEQFVKETIETWV